MKWILAAVAFLCANAALASAVRAEEDWPGRIYVEARGGVSAAADVSLSDIEQAGAPLASRPPLVGGPGEMGPGQLDYAVGWGVAAAAGYQINDYFRAELEVSYRDSAVKEIDLRNMGTSQGVNGPAGSVPATGGAQMIAGLVNGYFDIRQSPEQRVVPFVGVGVGAGYLDLDVASTLIGAYETKTAAFAWSAGFGVLWAITRPVGVSISYRYFGTPSIDVPSRLPAMPPLKMPYGAHESYVGLRYTF